MREIRLSGSEGGEATAFPTPIVIGSDFDVALWNILFDLDFPPWHRYTP